MRSVSFHPRHVKLLAVLHVLVINLERIPAYLIMEAQKLKVQDFGKSDVRSIKQCTQPVFRIHAFDTQAGPQ